MAYLLWFSPARGGARVGRRGFVGGAARKWRQECPVQLAGRGARGSGAGVGGAVLSAVQLASALGLTV